MNDRFSETRKRILALAESEPNILAVIEMGSQARNKNAADEFSDLDIVLVCGIMTNIFEAMRSCRGLAT